MQMWEQKPRCLVNRKPKYTYMAPLIPVRSLTGLGAWKRNMFPAWRCFQGARKTLWKKSENVLATPPLWRSALRDWRVLACGVLQGHRGSRCLCFLYPTANFFLRADRTPALTTQHHTRNLTTERQRRATRTGIWTVLRASLEALVSTTSRDMRTSGQSHPSTLMPLALDRQSSWIAGKPTGQRACPLKYQRRHLHGSSAVLSRAPDGTSTFKVLPWSSLCMEYLDHSVVV